MQTLEHDLETIGAMQRELLPAEIPQPSGWNLTIHYQVGRWPGGNYYDFLPLPDRRILFLLADASEQGGPAAALAAMLRVFIHSCPLAAGRDQSGFCPMHGEIVQAPHMLLENLNHVIAENSLAGQSMSVFCGILSPLEGTLHFANAGHPSPRWWHARSHAVEALRYSVGLPLGMDVHGTYHHKRIDIEPGDVLVFYTSGLSAVHRQHEFGLERLDAVLKKSARHGAEAVKNAVISQWRDCLGKSAAQDDVAVVVMQRRD
jgi:sigma-B regulation protein RsbU (phosphoserine phosphatase)